MYTILETANPKKIAASSVPRITPNAVSAYIAIQHKIKGPNQVISTACSSSAQAIGEAFRKIRNGDMAIAVTGGVEATISLINMALYQAMMVSCPIRALTLLKTLFFRHGFQEVRAFFKEHSLATFPSV